jgi:hypothetical protein
MNFSVRINGLSGTLGANAVARLAEAVQSIVPLPGATGIAAPASPSQLPPQPAFTPVQSLAPSTLG